MSLQNLRFSAAETDVKVPALLLDLIPQYLENRKQEILTLRDALTKDDFTTFQNIGHKLKGNAASYGFTYLTELGKFMESAAKDKNVSGLHQAIENYESYLQQVKFGPA